MAKNKGGRPPKIDKAALAKLEEAFAIGASDGEACFYADINPATLYRYQEKHPQFRDRKLALQQKPILAARREVVSGMKGNPDLAFRYLERKRKAEFGPGSEPNQGVQVNVVIYDGEKNAIQRQAAKARVSNAENLEVERKALPPVQIETYNQ